MPLQKIGAEEEPVFNMEFLFASNGGEGRGGSGGQGKKVLVVKDSMLGSETATAADCDTGSWMCMRTEDAHNDEEDHVVVQKKSR